MPLQTPTPFIFIPFLVALGSTACELPELPLPSEGSGDAEMVLRFINYPGTTENTLRADVGLTSREAQAVIDFRDGRDGLPVTEDDQPFRSIRELNLVVSASVIDLVLRHARERAWMPHQDPFLGYWDDISFELSEAELVLDLVNTASHLELDVVAGLKSNLVDTIIAGRPFHSIERLASVPQMGPVSLGRLKDYALSQTPEVHTILSQDGEEEL